MSKEHQITIKFFFYTLSAEAITIILADLKIEFAYKINKLLSFQMKLLIFFFIFSLSITAPLYF